MICHILIVEDDAALSQGIALALKDDRYSLAQAGDIAAARRHLAGQRFELVILDLNLPDGSGLDLLTELRRQGETAVIILSANDLETDIVTGLELGADDYITKPFSLMVLRARVNNQLRKAGSAAPSAFQTGPFRFAFEHMEFTKNGRAIELSKTEQKLLRILLENRGHTVARADLIDRLWTDGAAYVDENALSVTVKRLRDKLEDTPSAPRYIKTVYGLGYCWTAL